MQIVKLVGVGGWAKLAEREVDQQHPNLSHRFVIAAVKSVWNLEGGLEGLQTPPHSVNCNLNRHALQVKIGNFDVLAVAPIVGCDLTLLKALQEGFVVHDNLEDGGGGVVRAEHISLQSRKKRLEEIYCGRGGAAHIPNVLAKADLCQHILAVSDLADRGVSRGKLADTKTSGQCKLANSKHSQAGLAQYEEHSH